MRVDELALLRQTAFGDNYPFDESELEALEGLGYEPSPLQLARIAAGCCTLGASVSKFNEIRPGKDVPESLPRSIAWGLIQNSALWIERMLNPREYRWGDTRRTNANTSGWGMAVFADLNTLCREFDHFLLRQDWTHLCDLSSRARRFRRVNETYKNKDAPIPAEKLSEWYVPNFLEILQSPLCTDEVQQIEVVGLSLSREIEGLLRQTLPRERELPPQDDSQETLGGDDPDPLQLRLSEIARHLLGLRFVRAPKGKGSGGQENMKRGIRKRIASGELPFTRVRRGLYEIDAVAYAALRHTDNQASAG